MAKTSKSDAGQHVEIDGFEGHYDDLGGYVAGFESYDADQDPAPLFADTEIVEFSPSAELAATMAVVEGNLAAMTQ